jgi:hypothetical protein
MNSYLLGAHGGGKSTMAVELCLEKGCKVYLIAASPEQKDKKTGVLTFPRHFIRTNINALVKEITVKENGREVRKLIPAVRNCCILVDDSSDMMLNWKLYLPLLKEFRQYGLDIYATFHAYNLIPPKLVSYGTVLYCFRTNSRIPYGSAFAYPKEMEAARQYIQQYGDEHSFYIVNNITGKVSVCLKK